MASREDKVQALKKKKERGFIAQHETGVEMDRLQEENKQVPELKAEIARLLALNGDLNQQARMMAQEMEAMKKAAEVQAKGKDQEIAKLHGDLQASELEAKSDGDKMNQEKAALQSES